MKDSASSFSPTIICQAFLVWPGSGSRFSFNKVDLELVLDINFWKTNPEPLHAIRQQSTFLEQTLYYIHSLLTSFILTPLPKSVIPYWVVFDTNQQSSPTLNSCLGRSLLSSSVPLLTFTYQYLQPPQPICSLIFWPIQSNAFLYSPLNFLYWLFPILLRFSPAKGVVCWRTHNDSSVLLQVNFYTLTRTTFHMTPMSFGFFTFLLPIFSPHRLLRTQVSDKKNF